MMSFKNKGQKMHHNSITQDICNTDNYRGIALFGVLTKMYQLIIKFQF